MMIQFTSFNPQTKGHIPIWIDVTKIVWISSANVPGEISDGQGNPIPKEGTAINVGAGGMIVVLENPLKVLEQIPEDDPILVVEPPRGIEMGG